MNLKQNFWIKNFINLLIITVLFSYPSIALSQIFPSANPTALKGVKSFDAVFFVATWLNLSDDKDTFKKKGENAFDLALRGDGVIVEASAPNYLYCSVSAAGSNTGITFYSWKVEYFNYNADGVHELLFTKGGVATIGDSNFTAQEVAQDCTDSFASVWLAQNPPTK